MAGSVKYLCMLCFFFGSLRTTARERADENNIVKQYRNSIQRESQIRTETYSEVLVQIKDDYQ